MGAIRAVEIRQAGPLTLLAAMLVTSCAEPGGPAGSDGLEAPEPRPAGFVARTVVTVDGPRFRINGAVTYRGQAAEGMLMNVRMANAVFEDTNRPSFDPVANTNEFVARLPEYVK